MLNGYKFISEPVAERYDRLWTLKHVNIFELRSTGTFSGVQLKWWREKRKISEQNLNRDRRE